MEKTQWSITAAFYKQLWNTIRKKYGKTMQSIHFIQILSDIGAGKRGSHEGVKWLMQRHQLSQTTVFENHSETEFLQKPAKYIDNLQQFFQALLPRLSNIYKNEPFPLLLSGDHSNAIGTISALCKAYPEHRIGVVWIDAHADLHTPYTTPSGNLHGMSLAALIREDNQECALHSVNQNAQEHWQALKQLAPQSQGILPQDICFLGLRDYEPPEAALLERFNIPRFSSKQIRELGFESVFEAMKKQFNQVDMLYVSLDVDSLDSRLLDATGTPVIDGFTEQEVSSLLAHLLAHPKLAAFEITEFNPTLSPETKQYELVARLLAEVVTHIKNRPIK